MLPLRAQIYNQTGAKPLPAPFAAPAAECFAATFYSAWLAAPAGTRATASGLN